MKYRNLKTWVWMFLAFMLVALTGCEDKGCACGSEVTAPIAVATVSPRVSTVGDPVTFDASGSSDPDGSIVSYQWEEMTIAVNSTANAKKRKSSTRAVLSSAISFTTTELGVGLHTVTLTVTDDDGATGTTEVNVTVNALPNQLPVADAGVDQTVTEGSSVMLDGSASTDPDGTIISYEWKEGSSVLSTAVSFSKSDFSIGVHTIILTVIDDDGAVATDDVNVTVNSAPNQLPIADAGVDQSVTEGSSVMLDGSASTDPDGTIISYEWKEGSSVLSTAESFSKSDFSIGVHTLILTVTDDDGATDTDEVNVTVKGGCWVTISEPVLDINQSQEAEWPSLIIDRTTDKLYVVWAEGAYSESYYHVKSYDGASWTALGGNVNSAGHSGLKKRPVIKLDQSDKQPYLYYYVKNDGGYVYTKKWETSLWNDITSSAHNSYAEFDMDIDSNNYPVTMRRDSKGSGNYLRFQKYDGGSWSELTSIDGHNGTHVSRIILKDDDNPILVTKYLPEGSSYTHTRLYDYNGSKWAFKGYLESNTTNRQIACRSMIMDQNNQLLIAYVEKGTPNSSHDPEVYVKRYDASFNATLIGSIINGSTSVNTSGGLGSGGVYNQCISLAEDNEGNIYVAWQHEDGDGSRSIYTSKYDGTVWSEAAKPLVDDQKLRGPSLAIDSAGNMYIGVMYDSTPGSTDGDDIKVYRCGAGNGPD